MAQNSGTNVEKAIHFGVQRSHICFHEKEVIELMHSSRFCKVLAQVVKAPGPSLENSHRSKSPSSHCSVVGQVDPGGPRWTWKIHFENCSRLVEKKVVPKKKLASVNVASFPVH